MDADEEQVMELEGLEGIYADDFQQTSDKPPRAFSIHLAPMQEELPASDSDEEDELNADEECKTLFLLSLFPFMLSRRQRGSRASREGSAWKSARARAICLSR